MHDHNDYQLNYQKLSFEDKLRKYRMEYVADYLRTIKANKILEIGCGNDPIHFYFNDFEVLDLIEPGKHFYEFTKGKIENDPRITIQNCFLEEANLRDGYDVIIIGGFLHEIDNPEEVLAAVKNVANSNTIVITYVPNANSFHRILALESGLIKSNYEFSENDKAFGRRNVFNLESIQFLFKQSGFGTVKSDTYFIKPFTHGQMNELMESSFLTEELLTGFFKMSHYIPNMGCEIFLSARISN
jgi:SAM-dependent methyltransferase